MNSATPVLERVWELPPLILHPFSDPTGPDKLVESSRAQLMLQGLLPSGGASTDELEERLIAGRFCEIRMLFYVGRDLRRWLDQCVEVAEHDSDLRGLGLRSPSFAAYLIEHPPVPVKEKLTRWGVVDYKAIFTRAIGLNSVFSEVPDRTGLTPAFIRNYYRYADQMYAVWAASETCPPASAANFRFDLFASGEYSRMLEREWQES